MSNHVSVCQNMRFLLVFPIEFMLTAWKRQTNYLVCISVSRYSGKITRKEMPNYFCHYERYGEKLLLSTGKNMMDFD